MNEYYQCECPYHDDGDGFIGGGDCPDEGRIKTARYGWLCAECHDQLETAWEFVLEHRDELVVVDNDGNRIALIDFERRGVNSRNGRVPAWRASTLK